MTRIKTNEALLKALREASQHEPTAAELRDQRISFVMGSLKEDSTVTRDRVREILDRQEGHQE